MTNLKAPVITPGQPITDEQRRQMAEYNAQESSAANKMAADHKARDMTAEPLIETLAKSIGEKLNPDHLQPPGVIPE